MTGTTNDLLVLGRISERRLAGEKQKTSLGRLVGAEVEAPQMEAEAKQLSITCRVQEGLPGIIVDADRIRQALENVLDNAIKFTPEGGCITVTAGLVPGGGALEVAVQDSGPGIPPEQLDQIIAMFYQADATSTRRAGGLGLGLYIARGIAEAHGGDVRMESPIGEGSTCTLRLPLHPEGRPCD